MRVLKAAGLAACYMKRRRGGYIFTFVSEVHKRGDGILLLLMRRTNMVEMGLWETVGQGRRKKGFLRKKIHFDSVLDPVYTFGNGI